MNDPSAFDLPAYLARIGHHGAIAADHATLRALHVAHVGAIPFENLDIQMGLPIRLELAAIMAKLVGQRRGGYCFEQNSLLHAVLVAIGFDVTRRVARVRLGGDPGGRSHLILLVAAGERRYLADVGFGGSCLVEPLPLEAGEYDSAGERWRLSLSDWAPGWELSLWRDGGWVGLYWFGDEPVVDQDLIFGNHYTSTHPASRFVQNRVAARTTLTERHTLLNGQYRRRLQGALVEELEIRDEAMFRHVLRDRFLIELPDGAVLHPIEGISP
ncbi:arylamine N-acetyltransferase [Niveispirillum sp.]|uniref:arylamine N-acetyltransferase family protein n=1 Tax=Niveispirillum sp. TaxID=1917217 RepID=UPI001B685B02|nr:arylamine N-acetyltransferase [Niveispirillum sp.]MBP7334645.1 arylamine N-acetyltransferase [Niveispirillum sp.]